ncbi:MAG: hypothetical protein D6759_17275 [Chloroflexi bacterium]|nr:MAG: hypothetical protein D6759_17275 [Chloroflexota bacterium]
MSSLPRLYQSHPLLWDRLIPALGLAFLFEVLVRATGAYPPEWRYFLALLLLLLALARPGWAYATFALLAVYPLYRLSLYLAALGVAALIFAGWAARERLGPVVLTLSTPLLGAGHLATVVPLLAGFWWGEVTGALVGGLAALWWQTLAALAGRPVDAIALEGWRPSIEPMMARFHTASSWQTVLRLGRPFGPSSQALLGHLLMVLGWAAAGYLVGWLSSRVESTIHRLRWAQGLASLLSAGPSILLLWGSYGLPLVGLGAPPEAVGLTWERWQRMLLLPFWAAVLVALALRFRAYLWRPPLAPRRIAQDREKGSSSSRPAGRQDVQALPISTSKVPTPSPARPRANLPKRSPSSSGDGSDDIIMLELD